MEQQNSTEGELTLAPRSGRLESHRSDHRIPAERLAYIDVVYTQLAQIRLHTLGLTEQAELGISSHTGWCGDGAYAEGKDRGDEDVEVHFDESGL